MRSRRGWLIPIAVVAASIALTLFVVVEQIRLQRRAEAIARPEAPPDLARLRGAFRAGLAALQRGAGADAVREFSSFTFGRRAVEEYRLYFLANAYQVARNPTASRTTLATLWRKEPHLVYAEDTGLALGDLYASIADWRNAGDIYRDVAARTDRQPVAAAARWQEITARFAGGDIESVFANARALAVKNPGTPQSAGGIAIVRALSTIAPTEPLRLTEGERLERAVRLLRDGDPRHALEELNALAASGVPSDLRMPVQLNQGLALHHLSRFQESNAVLEPLASGPFRFAIPAIDHVWKNYRGLAAAIDPIVTRTITTRKRAGTTRVRINGKTVLRPKYVTIRETRRRVDAARQRKKKAIEALAAQQVKDLLTLPVANNVRIEALSWLIGAAGSDNDDAFGMRLVTELVELDPSQEAGLQHYWDKAWAAYSRRDLKAAVDRFTFIRDTYRNPNVTRQAEYWRARSIESLGNRDEATAVYRRIASAPYDDLYAIFSESRGAPRVDAPGNPLRISRPSWPETAEANMPAELRLAYELTALDDPRDARLEIQKNLARSNQMYADALLADIYHSIGDTQLMMRSLRRAFPQIATVDQDSVPSYFLAMYYPVRYEDSIVRYSKQNDLDPDLVLALIHQESYFNPKARSSAGAAGLMQMMPPTARELARRLHGSADVDNPEVSIRLGTFYLRQLVDLFGGSLPLAMASYNAGRGNVQRWRRAAPRKPVDEFIESMPFPETRGYVKRVTMLRASYRRIRR